MCDREALAQTSFRSRSRCACSSGLSTLSSAVPRWLQDALDLVEETAISLR